MKRLNFCLIAVFCVALISCESFARINLFEPWHPGQDSVVGEPYSYNGIVSFISGEKLLEIPFCFTYVSRTKFELGGRWGFKYADGNGGINDLLIGTKYQFVEESTKNPAVFAEGAVSLPTGDSSKGIGSGAVSLLLNWGIEKKIENVTGYFGLGDKLNSENADGLQEGNVFSFHIGISSPYKKEFFFFGEIKGFNHWPSKLKGAEITKTYQELYFAPAVSYTYKPNKTLYGALLVGLTSESHDVGLFISTNF